MEGITLQVKSLDHVLVHVARIICLLESAFDIETQREKSVDRVEVFLILCHVVYTRPRVKGDG